MGYFVHVHGFIFVVVDTFPFIYEIWSRSARFIPFGLLHVTLNVDYLLFRIVLKCDCFSSLCCIAIMKAAFDFILGRNMSRRRIASN